MIRVFSFNTQREYQEVTSHQQVQQHPAWHENLDSSQAEALLSQKDPFTYLLRKGDRKHSYIISFVQEDYTIRHQTFNLDDNGQGWSARNGILTNHQGPLGEFIPKMMHCSLEECSIVEYPE